MSRCFSFVTASALLLLSITPSPAAVIYTPTNGPTCHDFSKPEFGDWTCSGPGGYVARFTDEGNIATVSIGPGPRAKHRLAAQVRGSGKVFGDKIEWHVVSGVPKSAVLRMWYRDEAEREMQTLEVFLIQSDRTCSFGSIDASRPSANALAAERAEYATRSDCASR
jgi:hypothetical protein